MVPYSTAILITSLVVLMTAMTLSKNVKSVSDDVGLTQDYFDGLQRLYGAYGQALFGKHSKRTGEIVKKWRKNSVVNPEELGEYPEGDILFSTPKERFGNNVRNGSSNLSRMKNGISNLNFRWPGGVVYYQIAGRFDQNSLGKIYSAMRYYHHYTCIRFVPYNGRQRDYLRITSENTGCFADVGRVGGRQQLNLQVPGCTTNIGTILHEMMHTLGFFHEQSRPERDRYVNIHWDNIQPRTLHNFQAKSSKKVDNFRVPYDYSSLMHYSAHAFSRNGRETITPRLHGAKLGQRDWFSNGDLHKIRRMYHCR